MHDDLGRKMGAVANAAVVLLFAVLALGSSGAEVDHAEVRPWGCRTCPIPSPLPAGPPAEQEGLGPWPDGASVGAPADEQQVPVTRSIDRADPATMTPS